MMKGKVVMRFVGNRQEPEEYPEPPSWSGIFFSPALPEYLIKIQQKMFEEAQRISGIQGKQKI